MTSITIGQYIPLNTWIYKLDPRVKILLTIFWIVILFLVPVSNIYAMLTALAVMILITLTTRVPFMKMVKGMRPVLFLMLFTFCLQIIYYDPTNKDSTLLGSANFTFGLIPLIVIILLGILYFTTAKFMYSKLLYLIFIVALCFIVQSDYLLDKMHLNFIIDNVKFTSYTISVYDKALTNATSIVIRIICMLIITSLLTFTTRYQEINQGFASILSPLKIVKFPVGTFAMMLSLSLRFIPTLVEETEKIMKAQSSRGVDFNEGNLKQKVNQIISLLVPLFVVSFRKADDLANAMEARGYVMDQKRTSVDELKLSIRDFIVSLISVGVLVGVIFARIYL